MKALKLSMKWESLYGKTIKNRHIILEQYKNIHPNIKGPVFTGETLFMIDCDKNFVALRRGLPCVD